MTIETPTEENGPITKTVVVGGGVRLPVEGHRASIWVKVLSIDEVEKSVTVEYEGNPQKVGAFAIMDVLTRQEFQYQESIDQQPDPGAG